MGRHGAADKFGVAIKPPKFHAAIAALGLLPAEWRTSFESRYNTRMDDCSTMKATPVEGCSGCWTHRRGGNVRLELQPLMDENPYKAPQEKPVHPSTSGRWISEPETETPDEPMTLYQRLGCAVLLIVGTFVGLMVIHFVLEFIFQPVF